MAVAEFSAYLVDAEGMARCLAAEAFWCGDKHKRASLRNSLSNSQDSLGFHSDLVYALVRKH